MARHDYSQAGVAQSNPQRQQTPSGPAQGTTNQGQGFGAASGNAANAYQNGMNSMSQPFSTFANFGNQITQGFSNFMNPRNSVVQGIGGVVNAGQQLWGLGQQVAGAFGFGSQSPQAIADRKAEAAQERQQMQQEETADQDRRARAQQYNQTNAYGTVSWEYDENGVPHQVSQLDAYQQQLKDQASQMAGALGSQDAVQNAVDANTNAVMEQYHRQNDDYNQENLRKTRESLLARGLSEDSPAYQMAIETSRAEYQRCRS